MIVLYLLFFLTLKPLPIQASFLLVAHFHTYENTLHSFVDTSSLPIKAQCCDSRNCTESCNTILNYCFKKFGTVNDIKEDGIDDCLEIRSSTELLEALDYIDYSDPPLTISNTTTWKSIAHRGESWKGGMQFFVRATADDNVVDYMYTDISLSPGEIISNYTLHGEYFGENVTFVVSFNLNCTFNFYGENCSIYCKPANSSKDGRYTCDSEGNKICYEGYKNENCQECIPADGCSWGSCDIPGECDCLPGYGGPLCRQDLDVCGHIGPCHNQGSCNNTGPDSYQCLCKEGHHGVNCTENTSCNNTGPDSYQCLCKDGHHGVNCTENTENTDNTLPAYVMIIIAGVGGLLAPVVLLSPLIIILCFAGFGTWKNYKPQKEDNVDNPLYGQTPVPSVTYTQESENFSNLASSDFADNRLSSLSITATPSPCSRPLDDPNYAIIPAEEGAYNVLPPLSEKAAVLSIASSTLRSEADPNFSPLSFNLGESLSSYNKPLDEPDYDVIPEGEGTYKVPPPPVLALPLATYSTPRSSSLKSNRFSISSDPLYTRRHRSNTIPGMLRSESFKHQRQHQPSGLASNRFRCESAYSNVSSTTLQSQQNYSNLPSIAPNTPEREYINTPSSSFRRERGRSRTLSSEACNSFTAMSERELPSPPPLDDHKYDNIPGEGAYDVLPPPVTPHNGYESYDVPRNALINNSTH